MFLADGFAFRVSRQRAGLPRLFSTSLA
jgi:hypothetical protein